MLEIKHIIIEPRERKLFKKKIEEFQSKAIGPSINN